MSQDRISYQGYTVSTDINETEAKDAWSAVITISRGEGAGKESWMISAGDNYASRQEALTRCVGFARDLIDKEMEGCSLD